MFRPWLLPSLLFLTCVSAGAAPAAEAGALSYNRDIRPILSDKCFACHGMDSKTREADLRLDVLEEAVKPLKEGTPLVPGNPDASLVWQRIVSTDPEEVMPPPDSHKTLNAEEKEILRRWISQGAVYQKHWAFEPLVNPTPAESETPQMRLDRWVTERLPAAKLAPLAEAEPPVLIRRVSFALTGLPPSLDETEQFLRDNLPGAYERMVDRYLASPRYGEEMARHWLDVARYADTHGLHLDNERQMWAYRDWVVRAFNNNQPFDQFTVEQLAGDLLPEATQEQLIATGFNRCNVTTGEGGSIDAEQLFRYAVDRASTTAQTWLGLTVGCAACHDHKYDPVSQKEFYSFYAFFHSNADPAMDGNTLLTNPVMKIKPPDYQTKVAAFEENRNARQAALDAKTATVGYQDPAEQNPLPEVKETETIWFDEAFPAGAQTGASGHPQQLVEKPAPVASGQRSLKRSGEGMAQDFYQSGAAPLEVPAGGRVFLQVYLDPQDTPEEIMIQFHTGEWLHRAWWGQDIIDFGAVGTTQRFGAGPLPETGKWVPLEVEASSIGLLPGMKISGIAFTVHGGTAYFDRLGIKGRLDPSTDSSRSFTAWRKSVAGKDLPEVPEALRGWLKEGPDKERSGGELQQLRGYYLQNICAGTVGELAAETGALKEANKELAAYLESIPSTFIFRDLEQPRDSFVMKRGQYDQPGEKVEPGTPAVLPPLSKAGARANRLDLARWLVAPEHPLVSRVTVNRFWQQIFGTGLVKSSHDFGTQGDLPSHPELLDGLALHFQQTGWNVKGLMRLMLTSETFRRTSAAPPEAWQTDPDNRWLARGSRFRLDAEQLRDQALFAGGLLDLTMGGRGVNPYQPPNIWEPVAYTGSNTRNYVQSEGTGVHRRSLYTFYKRTAPAPFMINFDAPSREQACARRERSNTPLQALQLMNDVQHFEAARALAERILRLGGATPESRIGFACRTVLNREPTPEERVALLQFQTSRLEKYRATPAEATKAITFGTVKPSGVLKEPELASWTLVANLLLNLDEAVTRP
jgi:cytochrome c553